MEARVWRAAESAHNLQTLLYLSASLSASQNLSVSLTTLCNLPASPSIFQLLPASPSTSQHHTAKCKRSVYHCMKLTKVILSPGSKEQDVPWHQQYPQHCWCPIVRTFQLLTCSIWQWGGYMWKSEVIDIKVHILISCLYLLYLVHTYMQYCECCVQNKYDTQRVSYTEEQWKSNLIIDKCS